MQKRRFQNQVLGLLVLAILILSPPFTSDTLAAGLTIPHAMCGTYNGSDDGVGFMLLAEVVDSSNAIVQNAVVWVSDPNGKRYDLAYNMELSTYVMVQETPVVVGDYVFHAKRGRATAPAVVKNLSARKVLGVPRGITLEPSIPEAGKPLSIQWERVLRAAGYYVNVSNKKTQQMLWSSVGSVWDTTKKNLSVQVPGEVLTASTELKVTIVAINNVTLENSSALSGLDLNFVPGQPFCIKTVCTTTNSFPFGKFICLQLFLEDYFGRRIDKAVVWARYPSGVNVPFVHNINGWYEPALSDRPDPQDGLSFGKYTFFARYQRKLQKSARSLTNHFLPVPENVVVNPWPLVRNQAFTVNWSAVSGAAYYKIDVDEKATGKIIYGSPTSTTPFLEAPSGIWAHLTPGAQYSILTQSMNAGHFSDASATSFSLVDFTAP
jgi:hypothetical protein